MYRIFLAFRYVVARPISWISMAGIWITVASAIVSLSIMTGFLGEISRIYRGVAGDVVVIPFFESYFRGTEPKLVDYEGAIEQVEGVAAISSRIVRPVLLRVASKDLEAIEKIDENNFGEMIGLDATKDAAVSDFARYVEREREHPVVDPARPFWIDRAALPLADRELPVVLLGAGMRERFGLVAGDRVELATLPENADATDGEFTPLTQAFVVGGAVRCGHYRIDQRGLYVELDAARRFVGSKGGASEICIAARPGVDADSLATKVRSQLLTGAGFGCDVESWRARNSNDLAAVANQRSVLALLLFFFVLLACFNVFATMTILVTDKTRDIGILAAIGASPTGLLVLFAASGFVIAFVASIAGSVTGAFLALRINDLHDLIWHVTGTRIFKPDVYVFDRIPIELDAHVFPLIVTATVAFSVLCAAIPALRAARLDPVRALRQE